MENDSRCFWMNLKGKIPPNVERRVFVALCNGANLTGRPEDCTCPALEQRIREQAAEIHALRRRCATAEAAEAKHQARRALLLRQLRGHLERLALARRRV